MKIIKHERKYERRYKETNAIMAKSISLASMMSDIIYNSGPQGQPIAPDSFSIQTQIGHIEDRTPNKIREIPTFLQSNFKNSIIFSLFTFQVVFEINQSFFLEFINLPATFFGHL